MLTIHFTADDLPRVRVAPGADPMWELLLSLHLLGQQDGDVVFGDWKRRTRPRLGPSVRLLARLAPPRGYSADFLTPTAGAATLDRAVDAVLTTPRSHLATDLAELRRARPVPTWLRDLSDGEPAALQRLDQALRSYFRAALDPVWERVSDRVDADRALRARTVLDGGSERLLGTLHASVRWEPPVLRMPYPYHRDIHLDGGGLTLLPSFFCLHRPITLRRRMDTPVLVYPIDHELSRPGPTGERIDEKLRALLGRTRADVLDALGIQTGRSTSELAERLGISLPSASQHAAVLREAGLVESRQHGKRVVHTLTRIGRALLDRGSTPTPR